MLLACRFFSQKPHLAGSERQRELANVLAQKWREYGFDDVELPSYKVLLSYPMEDNPNVISVVADNGTIVKNFTEQITVRISFYSCADILARSGLTKEQVVQPFGCRIFESMLPLLHLCIFGTINNLL